MPLDPFISINSELITEESLKCDDDDSAEGEITGYCPKQIPLAVLTDEAGGLTVTSAAKTKIRLFC